MWQLGSAADAMRPCPRSPQALDVVLKHRVSYNQDCLAVGRGFFFHDQNVGGGGGFAARAGGRDRTGA